jgi:formyltetrahydrofolate hydrolase
LIRQATPNLNTTASHAARPSLRYDNQPVNTSAVLLLSSPMTIARKGVVVAISQFLIAHNGSVLHTDDHVDSSRDLFLSRLEWSLDGFDIPISEFEEQFMVSHRDAVEDMVQKGRDLEKVVLSRAVRWHLQNRILV